jgi:hypothetical protein
MQIGHHFFINPLDADKKMEEDHAQEVKGAFSKSRGRRELLNLECSINYDSTGARTARPTFFSAECFRWGSGLRAIVVCGLWVWELGFFLGGFCFFGLFGFSCARFSWVHFVVYFLCTLRRLKLFIILLFTYENKIKRWLYHYSQSFGASRIKISKPEI